MCAIVVALVTHDLYEEGALKSGEHAALKWLN